MAEQKIKSALLLTLGCRLNTADTALLTARLQRSGYMVSEDENDFPEPSFPDVVVINSCAVTAEAERKSRQLLRRIRRRFGNSFMVVTGCAAEEAASGEARLLELGADAVLPNLAKLELTELLTGVSRDGIRIPEFRRGASAAELIFAEKSFSEFPHRTRAFIKIQEGCNNFCSYCLVPYLRGAERSRDFDETLEDIRHAVDAGIPEVVLTGVNSCAYRTADGRGLADLVRAAAAIPGDFRIRLGSTEPHLGRNEVIDLLVEEPKMCRFMHLSLQHGSESVLRRMRRHYTAEEYAGFVSELRNKVPGVHIGSDFIVGFPGETEEEFQEGLEFVRRMKFANLHIFPYSPRPGTPAAEMPGRPDGETVRRRLAELRKVADTSAAGFADSQRGVELPVIFETEKNGIMHGWSDNYLEVTAPSGSFEMGKIVKICY